VGDRIAASHHVPCYSCHYCKLGHQTLCDMLKSTNFDPGGFSEVIRLPEINVRHGVYKLPDSVTFEEATFIEPLACVLRGQRKVDLQAEQTVLIIGCGVAGLLHLTLSKFREDRKVIACDLVPSRLDMARQYGADVVLDANKDDIIAEIEANNDGRLADVVIVCADSRSATLTALDAVGRGGSILFFALQGPDQVIPISMNEIFFKKGVTLTTSYAGSPEDHREALDLIQGHSVNVDSLITHCLGLSEVAEGFQLASNATKSLKIIIDPMR